MNGVKIIETAILTEVLKIELTNGNDGRGSKWFKTAAVRKTLESPNSTSKAGPRPVRLSGQNSTHKEPKSQPVALGAVNIGRGSSKELVDALVVCGWFTDDSPKHIAHCDFRQDSSQRENGPATLFEVFHMETSSQEMSGHGQTEPVELSTDFKDADFSGQSRGFTGSLSVDVYVLAFELTTFRLVLQGARHDFGTCARRHLRRTSTGDRSRGNVTT